MKRMTIEAGSQFGRLATISEPFSKCGRTYVTAKCECGKIKDYYATNLKSGKSKSCGCLLKERVTKHGCTINGRNSIYTAWQNMNARCSNPKHPSYGGYGGRGITVCEEWKNSFIPFNEWAKDKWKPKLTLDRIVNDGNYEPDNCEWIIKIDNDRKTRRTKLTMAKAQEIRTLFKNGSTRKQLREKFKVSKGVIQCVIHQDTWM